jgi:hypothetical protein
VWDPFVVARDQIEGQRDLVGERTGVFEGRPGVVALLGRKEIEHLEPIEGRLVVPCRLADLLVPPHQPSLLVDGVAHVRTRLEESACHRFGSQIVPHVFGLGRQNEKGPGVVLITVPVSPGRLSAVGRSIRY